VNFGFRSCGSAARYVIPGRCDSIEPGIHGATGMLEEMDSGPAPFRRIPE
jgi:hypothetical protein